MKHTIVDFLFPILFMISDAKLILVDFSKDVNVTKWRVVDDVVMGGRSYGSMRVLHNEGIGVFSGTVSLENNGGFSSIRTRLSPVKIEDRENIVIKLKGDGKNYQFRLRHQMRDYHSYIYDFETTGEWEIITIPLIGMKPQFRGRPLNMDNFDHDTFVEMAFLIGNKRAESFHLQIQEIYLE